MRFSQIFLEIFLTDIAGLAPLILALMAFIALAGVAVGKLEHWTLVDSVYQAFITATTVGYGELFPTKTLSKSLCVLIAFVGLLLTGIVVATGVHAVAEAYQGTISAAPSAPVR
jgi:hypothetical protein